MLRRLASSSSSSSSRRAHLAACPYTHLPLRHPGPAVLASISSPLTSTRRAYSDDNSAPKPIFDFGIGDISRSQGQGDRQGQRRDTGRREGYGPRRDGNRGGDRDRGLNFARPERQQGQQQQQQRSRQSNNGGIGDWGAALGGGGNARSGDRRRDFSRDDRPRGGQNQNRREGADRGWGGGGQQRWGGGQGQGQRFEQRNNRQGQGQSAGQGQGQGQRFDQRNRDRGQDRRPYQGQGRDNGGFRGDRNNAGYNNGNDRDRRGPQRGPPRDSNAGGPRQPREPRDGPRRRGGGEEAAEERPREDHAVDAEPSPADSFDADGPMESMSERRERRNRQDPRKKDRNAKSPWSEGEPREDAGDEGAEVDEDEAALERELREAERKTQKQQGKTGGSKVQFQKKTPDIFLPSAIPASHLARLLGLRLRPLQTTMMRLGFKDLRSDALLGFDDAALLCAEYNLNAVSNEEAAFDIYPQPAPPPAERSTLPLRPPVVTVMGHVDHGKTSLLDRLRSASVAKGEAGGITQHIGAFSVPVKAAGGDAADAASSVGKVTFLDTPGHAAFSHMRERGAKVTDIVVLVVAADDGVMAQTREVINVYKGLEAEAREAAEEERKLAEEADEEAAGDAAAAAATTTTPAPTKKKQSQIQLLVAVSKCDRPEANPDKVLSGLGEEGIFVEEFGGDVPCVRLSSKTGQGFDELEETLGVMGELADLRAPRKGLPEGWVLESRVEKGRGNTATVLVTRGTLAPGSLLVAGHTWAKVRQMVDSNGNSVRAALPGEAVLVSGWKDLPAAGDEVLSAGKEAEVKRAVENRVESEERRRMTREAEAINEMRRLKKEEELARDREEYMERKRRRAQLRAEREGKEFDEAAWRAAEGLAASGAHDADAEDAAAADGAEDAAADGSRELRLVLKSDFSGTGEALLEAVQSITTKGARVRIVSQGVGDVTESDVALARTAEAHIVGFNVSASKVPAAQVASGSGAGGGSLAGTGAAAQSDAQGKAKVPVYCSAVIYQIIEEVSRRLAALLPPIVEVRVLGEATIAKIFPATAPGGGVGGGRGPAGEYFAAGCRVTNGVLEKSRAVRVLRHGGGEERESKTVLWEGRMNSLKQVKKEVTEMRKGTECGVLLEGWCDFREGDVIQSVDHVEVPRTL